MANLSELHWQGKIKKNIYVYINSCYPHLLIIRDHLYFPKPQSLHWVQMEEPDPSRWRKTSLRLVQKKEQDPWTDHGIQSQTNEEEEEEEKEYWFFCLAQVEKTVQLWVATDEEEEENEKRIICLAQMEELVHLWVASHNANAWAGWRKHHQLHRAF